MSSCLYALIDPRDTSVRYIGYTSKPLALRLSGHLNPEKNPGSHRSNWIKQLKSLGLKPYIKFLRFASDDKKIWREQEKEEIKWWRNNGCDLVNTAEGGEGGATITGTKIKIEHVIKSGLAKRKTTPEQDEYIRKSYADKTKKLVELQKEFDISRATAIRIIYGRLNSFEEKPNIKKRIQIKKLTEEQVRKVRIALMENKTQKEITNLYGTGQAVISNIKYNKIYKGKGLI